MRKTNKQVHTYIVSSIDAINGGLLYKIGKTTNPQARFKQLRTGNPFLSENMKSVVGDYENSLHKVFAEFRYLGEWFKIPLDELNTERLLNLVIHEFKTAEEAVAKYNNPQFFSQCSAVIRARRIVSRLFNGVCDGMYVNAKEINSGNSVCGFVVDPEHGAPFLKIKDDKGVVRHVDWTVEVLFPHKETSHLFNANQ